MLEQLPAEGVEEYLVSISAKRNYINRSEDELSIKAKGEVLPNILDFTTKPYVLLLLVVSASVFLGPQNS